MVSLDPVFLVDRLQLPFRRIEGVTNRDKRFS